MPFQKRWLILAVVVLSPLMTIMAAPQWASEAWEEFRDYAEIRQNMREIADERSLLDVESDLVRSRIEIKEAILDEVETGVITFAQATNRFQALDRDRPSPIVRTQPPFRVGTERELAAISVIRHLRTRLESSHPHIGSTVKQVVGEFEHEFGYYPPS